MLSVSSISVGSSGYYISMSAERYYDEGVIMPSEWIGEGSALLGLSQPIDRADFQALVKGESRTGENLVQYSSRRQPGWDLTFSAPKSVSVVWALGDEATQKAVAECHAHAVRRAMHYVEESLVQTRRGKGGASKENSKLVGTLFHHGTSRNNDPQLHTHAVVHNVCVRNDGTTGTIMSKPFYQNKLKIGEVYRQELRAELELCGLKTYDTKVAFEIEGVDRKLMADFSSRRKEIEKRLGSESDAKASEKAALQTRKSKSHVDLEAQRALWREASRGWTPPRTQFRARRPETLSPDIGQVFKSFNRRFGPDVLQPLRKLTLKHGPDILDPLKKELARYGPDLKEPLRGVGPDIGQVWETLSRCAIARMEKSRARAIARLSAPCRPVAEQRPTNSKAQRTNEPVSLNSLEQKRPTPMPKVERRDRGLER